MYKIICLKTREEGKYDLLPGEESANINRPRNDRNDEIGNKDFETTIIIIFQKVKKSMNIMRETNKDFSLAKYKLRKEPNENSRSKSCSIWNETSAVQIRWRRISEPEIRATEMTKIEAHWERLKKYPTTWGPTQWPVG